MKIGLIGNGAIAGYVREVLNTEAHSIDAVLLRAGRDLDDGGLVVHGVASFPQDLDVIIDCAGHAALKAYGAAILERGFNLITVSLGALADQALYSSLNKAAQKSGTRLHLASGAIGALDCLQSARVGRLDKVSYIGRKPPQGWRGSPAEDAIDLTALTSGAQVHFEGSARQAALAYPKNANVAAAVALAGIGFDRTSVTLIADANVTSNIHEIEAEGEFGRFQFKIKGNALQSNPKSSALAAMSVVSKLDQLTAPITL